MGIEAKRVTLQAVLGYLRCVVKLMQGFTEEGVPVSMKAIETMVAIDNLNAELLRASEVPK